MQEKTNENNWSKQLMEATNENDVGNWMESNNDEVTIAVKPSVKKIKEAADE